MMSGTGLRRIYLARHGEAENGAEYGEYLEGWPDPPLSKEGRRQAALLARRLAGSAIKSMYASDLRRARETAEATAKRLGLTMELRRELREIHMGALHRQSWGELRAEDGTAYETFMRHEADLPYPGGGERGADAAARALRVLTEATENTEGDILIVCHGGIIRSLIASVLGLPQERRFLLGEPLWNTGLSALFLENGRLGLDFFNDRRHLER